MAVYEQQQLYIGHYILWVQNLGAGAGGWCALSLAAFISRKGTIGARWTGGKAKGGL